jgi:hypothetical protein
MQQVPHDRPVPAPPLGSASTALPREARSLSVLLGGAFEEGIKKAAVPSPGAYWEALMDQFTAVLTHAHPQPQALHRGTWCHCTGSILGARTPRAPDPAVTPNTNPPTRTSPLPPTAQSLGSGAAAAAGFLRW